MGVTPPSPYWPKFSVHFLQNSDQVMVKRLSAALPRQQNPLFMHFLAMLRLELVSNLDRSNTSERDSAVLFNSQCQNFDVGPHS